MDRAADQRQVEIAAPGGARLTGDAVTPAGARGLVAFAHGSGSSRHSPRNRMVAARLHNLGLATVLVDLLTVDEERADASTGHVRFDIDLLAERLGAVLAWAAHDPALRTLPVGCFGASTGAAAALVAAAQQPDLVRAVVSRGGRPDLAGERLRAVAAPTLLIVGGADHAVLDLNRQARELVQGPVSLEVVPGATHLFEEPSALEQVAHLAGGWFTAHLAGQPAGGRRG